MIGDLEDRVNNNEMIYPTDYVLEVRTNRVYRIVSYHPQTVSITGISIGDTRRTYVIIIVGGTMSRTKRGSKCMSYEYWSARPLNRGGGIVGRFTKKLTARIERRIEKKLIKFEVDDCGHE